MSAMFGPNLTGNNADNGATLPPLPPAVEHMYAEAGIEAHYASTGRLAAQVHAIVARVAPAGLTERTAAMLPYHQNTTDHRPVSLAECVAHLETLADRGDWTEAETFAGDHPDPGGLLEVINTVYPWRNTSQTNAALWRGIVFGLSARAQRHVAVHSGQRDDDR